MRELTAEWVAKAEQDFAMARLARASGEQVFDALGFHCQQCVEKYLKAALAEAALPFPKLITSERCSI